MPSRHVNGVDLYFEEHGEGAPILGIHGTPSSTRLWVDAARQLAHVGRCIIYDRRGFPRSKRPEPFDAVDLSDHVEDAVALLDSLSATPAIVIGRSTGGQIAIDLARRFPATVRALVLLEPAVFTVDAEANAWAGQLRETVLAAVAADPTSAAQTVLRAALGVPTWQSLPDELKEIFAAASPAVLAELAGRGLDLSAEPLQLSGAALAGIGHQTLIVSSADSPEMFRRVNYRLAEALPNADELLVPGGHLIDPAHPAVLDFIQRTLS